jgi:hypothetical protein
MVATHSVKFLLVGNNTLQASYRVVTNFVSEKEMVLMKRSCSEDSLSHIAAHIKLIKDTYKDLTGDTLTIKELSSTDSLEIIGFNVHNPKRTAYYKRTTFFELA